MIDRPWGTKLTLYRSWIKMQFQLVLVPTKFQVPFSHPYRAGKLQRLFLKHTIQGSKLNALTNEH